jgi:hypothetical protein
MQRHGCVYTVQAGHSEKHLNVEPVLEEVELALQSWAIALIII